MTEDCCTVKGNETHVKKEYDLIILGGGAAAFAAANTANKLKKTTLIINDKKILPLGGTCVNVGCVPSKIMLHQGATAYYASRSGFKAIKMRGEADFVKALEETREMVKGFQEKNYGKVINKQEFVSFKEGFASFKDKNTIKVGEEEFVGKNIIIATGASTFIPPVEGIQDVEYLTNKTVFFELNKKPESVIILGGGAEAMEFSQLFHHFGIKVTVLQRSERVLSKHDADIARELQKNLEEEGITIKTNTKIKKVEKTSHGVKVVYTNKDSKEESVTAEQLFVATGLAPHTKNLNLKTIGVKTNQRGFITTDKHLQTTIPHIYAVGDVNGLLPLETVAAKEGSTAAKNIFEKANLSLNYEEIPHAVFTEPQVAAVGITEEEYMKKYNVCLCKTVTWDYVEKAAAIKKTKGVLRMVIDPETKVILGVHIVGHMAADIITTATYAVKNKLTIYDVRDTTHVFPTMSEIIKKAAQSFDQNLDEMACCVE